MRLKYLRYFLFLFELQSAHMYPFHRTYITPKRSCTIFSFPGLGNMPQVSSYWEVTARTGALQCESIYQLAPCALFTSYAMGRGLGKMTGQLFIWDTIRLLSLYTGLYSNHTTPDIQEMSTLSHRQQNTA